MNPYVFSFDDVFPNQNMSTTPVNKFDDFLKKKEESGVDAIDQRIREMEAEFFQLSADYSAAGDQIRLGKIWNNIKLNWRMNRINERINIVRDILHSLYFERIKRTYG